MRQLCQQMDTTLPPPLVLLPPTTACAAQAATASAGRRQRWGIMGTAGIADVVLPAIAAAPGAMVLACASRSLQKATAWAAERAIPRAYGSYQVLIDDAEVDIVYIPLPTTLHIEWVIKAAQAGKHVLVEKPVGLNLGQVQRMVEACRANSVQIMDAVHWMHNPRTPRFMAAVRDEIGPLRRINASFCFPAHRREGFFEENIRTQADADPLGALGGEWCPCLLPACLAATSVLQHVNSNAQTSGGTLCAASWWRWSGRCPPPSSPLATPSKTASHSLSAPRCSTQSALPPWTVASMSRTAKLWRSAAQRVPFVWMGSFSPPPRHMRPPPPLSPRATVRH